MNPIAEFWGPDQFENLTSSGCGVEYSAIRNKIPEMMNVIEGFIQQMNSAIEDEFPK